MVTRDQRRLARQLDERELDLHGFERPRKLLEMIDEDLTPLLRLVNRPVVTARQFDRQQLLQLYRLAARFETQPQLITRPLTGKIMISAFYEPSTRTRLSFESAWHRLGGDIMSITDALSTGIAKGESYGDVAEMLNSYGDLVVLRDANAQSVDEMLASLRIPIINGGNGLDEHPTQSLADLYAMVKWRPQAFLKSASSSSITLGIIGVPAKMRTVRSLLLLTMNFPDVFKEIVIITDQSEPFDDGQLDEVSASGVNIRVASELEAELPHVDVVYQNAILWYDDKTESLGERFRLSKSSPLKNGAIILHPLARGSELSSDLDDTAHNWYFAQARGAMFVRMALLVTILKIFV